METTQNEMDIMAIETDVMAIETNLIIEANPFDDIATPVGNSYEPQPEAIITTAQNTMPIITAPGFEPEIDDMDLLNQDLANIQLRKEAEIKATELINKITSLENLIGDIFAKVNPEKANFKAWILGVIKGQNWYMNGFITAVLTALTTYLTTLQLETTGLNAVIVGLIISVVTILKPKK